MMEIAAAFAAAPIEDQILYVVSFVAIFAGSGALVVALNIGACFIPASAFPDRRNEWG